MDLIFRCMANLIPITVTSGRRQIHVLSLINHWIPPYNGAASHTSNSTKTFLIQTFGEERIISKHCTFPWLPRSPDLTP
ncbi:UNVERIFIED_CONTAM: hypothetical protein NCL1_30255 [Trichonephila clavipes]